MQDFAATWCVLSGGLQGLFATGHMDGTIRIWLRSSASLLLLQVLSTQPCAPLPWRIRLKIGEAEPTGSEFSYDGIDACPAFGEEAKGCKVTAVSVESSTGVVVAGCLSGEVIVFSWQTSSSNFTSSEAAEWHVQTLLTKDLEENPAASKSESADLPQLPSGFVCSMRLRQHQSQISLLKLVHVATAECSAPKLLLFSADSSSQMCITDCFTGETRLLYVLFVLLSFSYAYILARAFLIRGLFSSLFHFLFQKILHEKPATIDFLWPFVF